MTLREILPSPRDFREFPHKQILVIFLTCQCSTVGKTLIHFSYLAMLTQESLRAQHLVNPGHVAHTLQ